MSRPRRLAAVGVMLLLCLSCSDDRIEVSSISIDGRPSAVTYEDGNVFIADDENHVVHVVDAKSMHEVNEPIPVGRNPIAMTSGGPGVWVAHASGSVVRIDTRRLRADEAIELEGSFTGIAFHRGFLWLADVERGLLRVDPADPSSARWFRLKEGAVRVIESGGRLWTSGVLDTVTRLDPKTGERKVFESGLGPIGLVSFEGGVWVANSDDSTVQRVDTGRVVTTGKAPVALAVAAGDLWSVNQDGGSLSRISGGRVRQAVPLQMRPRGVAAGHRAVWAVGTNPGLLVRVLPGGAP